MMAISYQLARLDNIRAMTSIISHCADPDPSLTLKRQRTSWELGYRPTAYIRARIALQSPSITSVLGKDRHERPARDASIFMRFHSFGRRNHAR
jgi:hypothetical protein